MEEENYEISEELRKRLSESMLAKKLASQFKNYKRLSETHSKDVPIIDLEATKLNLLLKNTDQTNIKEIESITVDSINPFPHIFSNYKAYSFFELLHENFKKSKFPLADYSFIYRMMYKENLIVNTFKAEMFKNWIGKEPYCIDSLDKIKTLEKCTTAQKETLYSYLKSTIYNSVP